jgi:CheY-like chemotaxis protein
MTTTEVLEASQPIGSDPRSPLRLLHVEDNLADALLVREYLIDVLAAVQFDTAERLAELTPERAAATDCALLDLSLPDASGFDAVVALRRMSAALPIVVLTGYDNLKAGLAAVLRDGADDYLLKSHADGHALERSIR